MEDWFGPTPPIGEWEPDAVAGYLSEIGDGVLGDELLAHTAGEEAAVYGVGEVLAGIPGFSRFAATTNICGFLPASGGDRLVPVARATPDTNLQGEPLRITLDTLHVARYPGLGTHSLLFDFAVERQGAGEANSRYHFNAKFEARNGATVPAHNFPLFYGLEPSAEGIVFGFQTVNVDSSFNRGLLDFLDGDEFKAGLSLLHLSPVVGQLSQMAASLASWLAGRSKNAKVMEFRQGLSFAPSPLGGCLAEGHYVVAQIPVDSQRDWSWDDWVVDPTLQHLVQREDRSSGLDFNHFVFGVQRMPRAALPPQSSAEGTPASSSASSSGAAGRPSR